ncbi:MAG: hypothetical protein WCY67_07585 [Acidithiobacillus sp.]
MPPRKKKPVASRKGRWIVIVILALLATAIVIGIALNVPLHIRQIPPAVPSHPTPLPKVLDQRVDLGSYGVTVSTQDGGDKVLTIHPIAILQGSGVWHPIPNAQSHFDALIANPFMAFPNLDQVAHSATAQEALSQQIQTNITPTLNRLEPGWTILHIQLHPALQSPPAGDS